MRRPGLLLALLFALSPVYAATPAPQAAPSKPVSADVASDADVDRLLQVMNMRTMMAGMMKQIGDTQGNMVADAFAHDLSDADRKRMKALLDKTQVIVQKRMSWEVLEPVIRKVYAQVFSKQEVQAMTTFYASPEGASILMKAPQATALTMQEIQPIAMAVMEDVKALVDSETKTSSKTDSATTEKK